MLKDESIIQISASEFGDDVTIQAGSKITALTNYGNVYIGTYYDENINTIEWEKVVLPDLEEAECSLDLFE